MTACGLACIHPDAPATTDVVPRARARYRARNRRFEHEQEYDHEHEKSRWTQFVANNARADR